MEIVSEVFKKNLEGGRTACSHGHPFLELGKQDIVEAM